VYQCVSYPLTRVTHLRGEFDPSCPIFRVGSVLFVRTKASSAQQTLVPDQKHVRRELRKESCCITWCQPIWERNHAVLLGVNQSFKSNAAGI